MLGTRRYKADELANLLKKPLQLVLIDVRDQDFGYNGLIKYAVNIPSFDFDAKRAKEIIEACCKKSINDIVCYCSYGRARSVQCAAALESARSQWHADATFGIGYLEGGFVRFRASYYNSGLIVSKQNLSPV